MSEILAFFDDDGVLKKVPDYEVTVYFETEEEMNTWVKKQKESDKYAWHDVRKNPDDQPKVIGDYIVELVDPNGERETNIRWFGVAREDSGWTMSDWDGKSELWWTEQVGSTENERVIAWREIEPFEGVE